MEKKCSYCGKQIEFEYFLCESSDEIWCNNECLMEDNNSQGYTNEQIDRMFKNDVIFWTTL